MSGCQAALRTPTLRVLTKPFAALRDKSHSPVEALRIKLARMPL
jgi:hypothetical protein